jgi:hypothetical protein
MSDIKSRIYYLMKHGYTKHVVLLYDDIKYILFIVYICDSIIKL